MTLAITHPTLLDVTKRLDPNGNIAMIGELLNKQMPILDDIPWFEANDGSSNKTTVRASIPAPTFRLFNQGVAITKSTTKQIRDTCAMLKAYSEVDKDLADLHGASDYRFGEDLAHIEGMGNAVVETLFYGDTDSDPEKFVGFAPRYFATTGAVTSPCVLDAGGTGSVNTSIYVVGWGQRTVHGIYPKNSKGGVSQRDLGERTKDASDGAIQVYTSVYDWHCGLVVKDWRAVIRIANIDVNELASYGESSDTSANLLKLLTKAKNLVSKSKGITNPVIYANEAVCDALEYKMQTQANVRLKYTDWSRPGNLGKIETLTFAGLPVRRIEESLLLSTESRVVAA